MNKRLSEDTGLKTNLKQHINWMLSTNKSLIISIWMICLLFSACNKDGVIPAETNATSTPHFSWDITVELNQPNGWCLTSFPNRVTLTHIAEGKQYMITWKGDFSQGEKEEGILKTIVCGKDTKTTDLEVLEIQMLENGSYSLAFRGGGRKGEMIFMK